MRIIDHYWNRIGSFKRCQVYLKKHQDRKLPRTDSDGEIMAND